VASIDPITLTLTGQLPLILLLAAALALPTSLVLLRLYKRAVLQSMRVGASGPRDQPTPARPSPALVDGDRPGHEVMVPDHTVPMPRSAAPAIYSELVHGAPRAAAAYALGGFAYAIVMAAGLLAAGHLELRPVRFLLLSWTYAWPIVLTTTMALGSTRRTMLLTAVVYFLGYAALTAVGVALSPAFDSKQAMVFWLLNNGPPTVLLLAFLNRRVRAVGPLVLIFMILAVTGSSVAIAIVDGNKALLKTLVDVGSALGLGGSGIFIGLILVGFSLLGVMGWLTLVWLRQRYEKKRVSDQSITFDAIWLLFAVEQSIGLVFEGAAWILTGVAAFAGYKLVSTVALSLLSAKPKQVQENTKLLLLRVFALGSRSERMFEVLGAYWRYIGSIQLIAGPDLVTKTVEPHEFLDFLSGKLARRFIDGPAALERRVSEMDTGRDQDGRFRVNDFFCHDDTWRMVLSRLVHQTDTVLMDLRSFSPQNAGVAFEVEELMNLVPLERAVFVIDDTTSEQFLHQVIQQSWGRLRPDSPNRNAGAAGVRLLRFKGLSGEIQDLLGALCTAAKSPASLAVASTA
jgi:hypothetical protein